MEPKPKERIVFDEDLYYGDEGEEMAINDLMERDGLTEGEVREDEANRNRLPQELCGSSPRRRGHGSYPLPLPTSCDRPRGFRRIGKG